SGEDLLVTKLADLRLIYDQYIAYLGQDRVDPHRRLEQILEAGHGCSMFEGADVYVDGFYDFSHVEKRLITGVAKACRSMQVALTVDPDSPTIGHAHHIADELATFHRTETTYHLLWREFKNEKIE